MWTMQCLFVSFESNSLRDLCIVWKTICHYNKIPEFIFIPRPLWEDECADKLIFALAVLSAFPYLLKGIVISPSLCLSHSLTEARVIIKEMENITARWRGGLVFIFSFSSCKIIKYWLYHCWFGMLERQTRLEQLKTSLFWASLLGHHVCSC